LNLRELAWAASGAAFLASLLGCALPPKDPEERIVFACTAGLVRSTKGSVDVEADLKNRKLKSGLSWDETVRGYVFEALPEKDRLEALKLYYQCRDKYKREVAGLPLELVPLVHQSQYLWNRFAEAEKLDKPLPSAQAEGFALAGAAFRGVRDEGFDAKARIVKNDRQAIMYFLASEVILRSPDARAFQARAGEYAKQSYEAVRAARAAYQELQASTTDAGVLAWLRERDVRSVLLNRAADVLAQLSYVTASAQYAGMLDATLGELPCDYINLYMARDLMYRRIATPRRFADCAKT